MELTCVDPRSYAAPLLTVRPWQKRGPGLKPGPNAVPAVSGVCRGRLPVLVAQFSVKIGAADVRTDDQATLNMDQLRLAQRGASRASL